MKNRTAKAASDGAGPGPGFTEFARLARQRTDIPLMVTGGFKSCAQAVRAVSEGSVDVVGIARALILAPDLVTSIAHYEARDAARVITWNKRFRSARDT